MMTEGEIELYDSNDFSSMVLSAISLYKRNVNQTDQSESYENVTKYGEVLIDTYDNFTIDSDAGETEISNYWALLALVLVFGTACGNILVCLAIAWEKRLQNVTNYFLASLAITDLMVAILVMPLGIVTLYKGKLYFLIT
jgi:hypothetical protein